MKPDSGESGLDELMRLSRQTARQAQNLDEVEKQRRKQREQSQSIRQGLKEISVSVAVGQLKPVAAPELVEKVSSLAQKPDIKDLRKLITDLVHGLERQTDSRTAAAGLLSGKKSPAKD